MTRRVGIDVRWLHDGLTHEPGRELLGGIGNYIANVVPRVISRRPDWSFVLFGQVDRPAEILTRHFADYENVQFVYLARSQRSTSFARGLSLIAPAKDVSELGRTIDAQGVELFHSTSQFEPAGGTHNARVITVHDAISAVVGWPSLRSLHWRRRLRSYFGYDAIITDSESTKRDLARIGSVDSGRITTIHLAIGPEYRPLDPSAAAERVAKRYGMARPYLLYVGGLQPTKNVPRLLLAYQRLSMLRPNTPNLMIAGAEPLLYPTLHASVRRRIAALGLESSVVLLPFVPGPHLVDLYNAATAFVFPSLYEGFGLPPGEAMACGIPVVTSRRASLPELMGDAAVYVDPERVDDICRGMAAVLDNPQLRQSLREQGLQRAPRFTWDATADRHVELYERVLA